MELLPTSSLSLPPDPRNSMIEEREREKVKTCIKNGHKSKHKEIDCHFSNRSSCHLKYLWLPCLPFPTLTLPDERKGIKIEREEEKKGINKRERERER